MLPDKHVPTERGLEIAAVIAFDLARIVIFALTIQAIISELGHTDKSHDKSDFGGLRIEIFLDG